MDEPAEVGEGSSAIPDAFDADRAREFREVDGAVLFSEMITIYGAYAGSNFLRSLVIVGIAIAIVGSTASEAVGLRGIAITGTTVGILVVLTRRCRRPAASLAALVMVWMREWSRRAAERA